MRRSLLCGALAREENLVDEAVLLGLGRAEDLVALDVAGRLLGGAAGVQGKGYPNLLDNDWLWGGDLDSIHTTITHGIRNTTDGDARYSEMPKFGVDGLLEPAQIGEVVEYVLQISGQDHDATKAATGATLFADNCSACHGQDGKGDRAQGAPNLTDAVWLYGGDRDTITYTVVNARFGVMPNWNQRLSEDEIRAVAYYVHSRGGGE